MARREAVPVMHPDQLHFRRVRASWPDWFPGRSEPVARELLFQETELLRDWYQNMLDSEPPYPQAARGYVAAYMPRGYFWFAAVVEDSPRAFLCLGHLGGQGIRCRQLRIECCFYW